MSENRIQVILGAQDRASTVLAGFKGRLDDLFPTLTALNQGFELARKGLEVLKAGFANTIGAAAEEEQQLNRIKTAVDLTGESYELNADRIDGFITSMVETTRFADDQLRPTFQTITQLTGDLNKGFEGTKIAANIASSGILDLDTATRFVAQAMSGNVEVLGRYIPQLKASAGFINDNMTADEKWAKAKEILNQKFGSGAQRDLDTTIGQYNRMKNAVHDVGEIIGGPFLDGIKDTASFLADAATGMKDFLQGIDAAEKKAQNMGQAQKDLVAQYESTIKLTKDWGYWTDQSAMAQDNIIQLYGVLDELQRNVGLAIDEDTAARKKLIAATIDQIHANEALVTAYKNVFSEKNAAAQKAYQEEQLINLTATKNTINGIISDWRELSNIQSTIKSIKLIDPESGVDKQMDETRELVEVQESAATEYATYIDSLQTTKYQFLMNMGDMMMSQTHALSSGLADILMGGKNKLKDVFKGMAKDFITFFIDQALQAVAGIFVAKLLKILGSLFDTPANDAMAARQGADFAKHFTMGMEGYFNRANLGGRIAGYAGASGGSSVVVHIHGSIIGDENYIVKSIEKAVDTGRSRLLISGGSRGVQY